MWLLFLHAVYCRMLLIYSVACTHTTSYTTGLFMSETAQTQLQMAGNC